jgi:hypothetical protein
MKMYPATMDPDPQLKPPAPMCQQLRSASCNCLFPLPQLPASMRLRHFNSNTVAKLFLAPGVVGADAGNMYSGLPWRRSRALEARNTPRNEKKKKPLFHGVRTSSTTVPDDPPFCQ